MPNWPTSLPQAFQPSNFSMQPLDNSAAIDVESGEPLTRLRFTGDMSDVAGNILLDVDEVTTFRNFWNYDLARGTLRFTWSDAQSGAAVEYLFTAPPKYTCLGGRTWQVDMALRMIS